VSLTQLRLATECYVYLLSILNKHPANVTSSLNGDAKRNFLELHDQRTVLCSINGPIPMDEIFCNNYKGLIWVSAFFCGLFNDTVTISVLYGALLFLLSCSRNFQHFMEPKGSLLCPQEPATCLLPEAD
jgi:hypothetical protein